MNLLHVELTAENPVRISDRRRQHVLKVHRAKQGEQFKVGQLNGMLGQGSIMRFKQGVTTQLTKITKMTLRKRFKNLVEDELPAMIIGRLNPNTHRVAATRQLQLNRLYNLFVIIKNPPYLKYDEEELCLVTH